MIAPNVGELVVARAKEHLLSGAVPEERRGEGTGSRRMTASWTRSSDSLRTAAMWIRRGSMPWS